MAPRTKVNRIDGASVDPTGFHFKRLGVMRANIRRGYQVEMLPYPRDDGKWLVRVVKPKRGNVSSAEVDSYFEIIAKNQEEAEAFIKKDGLWGGALAERVAARIGKRGEAHAVRRLAPGSRVVDSVTGKTLEFASVKQFQNASGNGVDILARLAKDAEPTPPPNAGDFFAFEVKSTLGALDNPPGLSAAQKNPIKRRGFLETRIIRALEGTGSYPPLSASDETLLEDALDAVRGLAIYTRKIDIRMDHSGSLASTGGKMAMEIREWL